MFVPTNLAGQAFAIRKPPEPERNTRIKALMATTKVVAWGKKKSNNIKLRRVNEVKSEKRTQLRDG